MNRRRWNGGDIREEAWEDLPEPYPATYEDQSVTVVSRRWCQWEADSPSTQTRSWGGGEDQIRRRNDKGGAGGLPTSSVTLGDAAATKPRADPTARSCR